MNFLKKITGIILSGLLALSMTGCAGKTDTTSEKTESGIDYMVLVNRRNCLPEGWEENLEIEHFTNSVGDEVKTESKAYEEYCALKEEVEKDLEGYEKGEVKLELDSAYRSVEEQQRIWDDFTQKYGDDYTRKTVAVPGYSEHHTGLALDLYLIVDGKDIVENEDLITYPEIWEKIHEKLANYGFILRYTPGAEYITGYAYEPWHIRYVGMSEDLSTNVAMLISASGRTG
jgi:D-alanyl-D-alanine carboxypeptidase